MWDYISLAAELVRLAPEAHLLAEHPPLISNLMREAAVMLRKQGDELEKLKNENCPDFPHVIDFLSKPEPEENDRDFKW